MMHLGALDWASLYQADETAWLEAQVDLIQRGQVADLDYSNLAEYLADMARRDRREVESRLAVLLAHLLKWTYKPDGRTGSWRGTIVVQRQELRRLLDRGVLRNHAEAVLADACRDAVEQAAAETGLPELNFPNECPYTLDQVISQDIFGE